MYALAGVVRESSVYISGHIPRAYRDAESDHGGKTERNERRALCVLSTSTYGRSRTRTIQRQCWLTREWRGTAQRRPASRKRCQKVFRMHDSAEEIQGGWLVIDARERQKCAIRHGVPSNIWRNGHRVAMRCEWPAQQHEVRRMSGGVAHYLGNAQKARRRRSDKAETLYSLDLFKGNRSQRCSSSRRRKNKARRARSGATRSAPNC